MQVCARHSKKRSTAVVSFSWLCKMSTYSASGERILQVADPKLLESVDCSKGIKQYDFGMSEVYIGLFEGSG